MNLYDAVGRDEQHPAYRKMATENYLRYYDFLDSIIEANLSVGQHKLSHSLIKAINFHAIVGLHPEAGEYRNVPVTAGPYVPPPPESVGALMVDYVDRLNESWALRDAVSLAAIALWRLNYIHPFVNGNGRTARAVCYYILCVKSGDLLPGKETVPEMLRAEPVRGSYIKALQQADEGNLAPIVQLLSELLTNQLMA